MASIVEMPSNDLKEGFLVGCGDDSEYAPNTGGSKLHVNNSGYL